MTWGIRERVQGDGSGASTSPLRARGLGRLRVRTSVLLVVLLPTIATLVLVSTSASSRWTYKSNAQGVQNDVAALDRATSALTTEENWAFAAEGITYGWKSLHLGISEIKSVINVDLGSKLVAATRGVTGNAQLAVGANEKRDQAEVGQLEDRILNNSVDYQTVYNLATSYENLALLYWTSVYDRVEHSTSVWQPPGTFSGHVAAIQATFRAYIDMLHAISDTNDILSANPQPSDLAQYFSAVSDFDSETGRFYTIPGFPQTLGLNARNAWEAIQNDPHLVSTQQFFTKTVRSFVATQSTAFAVNFVVYAQAFRYIGDYLDALGNLMHAETLDLHDATAQAQASASDAFTGELAFASLLLLLVIGGAAILTRSVTAPVGRLGKVAADVQKGEFATEPLPESGPLELSAASRTFNDMVGMLRSLEAKTVALASEDLSDPVLQEPLPGRAGKALQRSVEQLTTRVREREIERLQLKEEATHDALTGLLNRPAIMNVLTRDLDHRPGEGDVVATVFVDLNGLKTINDTYGHDAGDAAIRATSEALRNSIRRGDAVARLGGDEFLVIAHVRSEDEAHLIAHHITETVAASTIETSAGTVPLSCSTGVAVSDPGSASDPAALIRAADTAMYSAKRRRGSGEPVRG